MTDQIVGGEQPASHGDDSARAFEIPPSGSLYRAVERLFDALPEDPDIPGDIRGELGAFADRYHVREERIALPSTVFGANAFTPKTVRRLHESGNNGFVGYELGLVLYADGSPFLDPRTQARIGETERRLTRDGSPGFYHQDLPLIYEYAVRVAPEMQSYIFNRVWQLEGTLFRDGMVGETDGRGLSLGVNQARAMHELESQESLALTLGLTEVQID